MGLQEELDARRPEIKTDSYAMSLGEWISLYERRELDIHPEFQRFFRWTDFQKTRLLESILLGIPIPAIFVSQRADGVWDVIDGLQRLSTVFQLVGILKGENGNPVDRLILQKTQFLPSLDGMVWEDDEHEEKALTPAQRLYIKRSKLHVNIIQRESGSLAKYELFQRLNTGGSQLSDQEIRNCILVQENRDLFYKIRDLATYPPFLECTVLSDRATDEQYTMELVLRFVVFRTLDEARLSEIGDLGDFLTREMVRIARLAAFDFEEEARAFRATFDILNRTAKDKSFRRFDAARRKFVGGFLVTSFEVFAVGIGANYSEVEQASPDILSRIKHFWIETRGELSVGSGVRASTRIPATIPYGRQLFSK